MTFDPSFSFPQFVVFIVVVRRRSVTDRWETLYFHLEFTRIRWIVGHSRFLYLGFRPRHRTKQRGKYLIRLIGEKDQAL